MADELAVEVYRVTSSFPSNERYGLKTQLRRAAVSAASTIVEGSARRSTAEYLNFLNIAAGSSAESRYLVNLSHRLGLLPADCARRLDDQYDQLSAQLNTLIRVLGRDGPRPGNP